MDDLELAPRRVFLLVRHLFDETVSLPPITRTKATARCCTGANERGLDLKVREAFALRLAPGRVRATLNALAQGT